METEKELNKATKVLLVPYHALIWKSLHHHALASPERNNPETYITVMRKWHKKIKISQPSKYSIYRLEF